MAQVFSVLSLDRANTDRLGREWFSSNSLPSWKRSNYQKTRARFSHHHKSFQVLVHFRDSFPRFKIRFNHLQNIWRAKQTHPYFDGDRTTTVEAMEKRVCSSRGAHSSNENYCANMFAGRSKSSLIIFRGHCAYQRQNSQLTCLVCKNTRTYYITYNVCSGIVDSERNIENSWHFPSSLSEFWGFHREVITGSAILGCDAEWSGLSQAFGLIYLSIENEFNASEM